MKYYMSLHNGRVHTEHDWKDFCDELIVKPTRRRDFNCIWPRFMKVCKLVECDAPKTEWPAMRVEPLPSWCVLDHREY